MTIRTKRNLCRVLGVTALLLTLGVVGGMEWGSIPFWRGAALSALCELTGICLLWKGGVIRVR